MKNEDFIILNFNFLFFSYLCKRNGPLSNEKVPFVPFLGVAHHAVQHLFVPLPAEPVGRCQCLYDHRQRHAGRKGTLCRYLRPQGTGALLHARGGGSPLAQQFCGHLSGGDCLLLLLSPVFAAHDAALHVVAQRPAADGPAGRDNVFLRLLQLRGQRGGICAPHPGALSLPHAALRDARSRGGDVAPAPEAGVRHGTGTGAALLDEVQPALLLLGWHPCARRHRLEAQAAGGAVARRPLGVRRSGRGDSRRPGILCHPRHAGRALGVVLDRTSWSTSSTIMAWVPTANRISGGSRS